MLSAGHRVGVPLASLYALNAWFNPVDERIQRSYSAGDIGVALYRSLTDYGCRILTTWLCAEVGHDICSDAAQLPAGSSPGGANLGNDPVRLTGLASIRAALHIPEDVKTLLVCDSTLTGHPSKKVYGSTAEYKSPLELLRERHPRAIYVDMTVCGCKLSDMTLILLGIPPEARADYDHTLVVTMFNGKSKQYSKETSQIGVQILQLCEALKEHRRPLVVLGGNGDLWGYDEAWGKFVQKALLICHSQGIPAIDGVDSLANIPKSLAIHGTYRTRGRL